MKVVDVSYDDRDKPAGSYRSNLHSPGKKTKRKTISIGRRRLSGYITREWKVEKVDRKRDGNLPTHCSSAALHPHGAEPPATSSRGSGCSTSSTLKPAASHISQHCTPASSSRKHRASSSDKRTLLVITCRVFSITVLATVDRSTVPGACNGA